LTLAVPPQDTDIAFLREVDEGVRRDQVASLWQRYGTIGVTLLVLLLGSLGGWLWWQDAKAKAAGVAGENYALALNKLSVGENASVAPVLADLAAKGPGGYSALARLTEASAAVSVGNNDKAIKLLDAIAADSAVAPPLRDAALVKSVQLGFDALPPATIVERLKGLSIPGNPWFGVAGEMTALARVKAGQIAEAKPLLTAIVRDTSNPPNLRGRVAQLALSLGVDEAMLQLPSPATTADQTPPVAAPAAPAK
jgi:hypothetical protein